MLSKKTSVTPAVLEWAVGESGFELAELAQKLGHPKERLESWIEGSDQPTQAQLRNFAKQVRRPSALFYLSAPPEATSLPPSLRNAPGLHNRKLSVAEIRVVRWLTRVQQILSWLRLEQLGHEAPTSMPAMDADSDFDEAAARFREWIGVSVDEQISWQNARIALQEWRDALTGRGVAVFQFQIDKGAIRGFSVWNDQLPVAAVNTAYTPQARVYTLFHEVGHLLRRAEGACAAFSDQESAQVERWCDRFAAAFLLPGDDTIRFAGALYDDQAPDDVRYEQVRKVARRFKTSVRATAIRLIELGLAREDLYGLVATRAIQKFEDFPKPSSGGGGRTVAQIRLQHFGKPVITTLLRGINSGHITTRDIGDYLHLPPSGVTDIASLVSDPSSP